MRWWPCLVRRWIAVGLALLGLSIAAQSAHATAVLDWCQQMAHQALVTR